MKYSSRIVVLIATLVISQVAYSGTVVDTFADGDTLTATHLDNIKTAVNDNDAEVTTNASDIATNLSHISDNMSDISTNESDIASNSSSISTNAGGVSSNSSDIVSNDSRITALEGASSSPGGYGDGSSGALVISASEDWSDTGGDAPANDSLQFTDLTINAGQTLSVPSGTVIRCTGTFTNNGTLSVAYSQVSSPIDNGPDFVSRYRGDNYSVNGNWNAVGETYDATIMRQLLSPGPVSGQRGGNGNVWNAGGSGGGSLVIRCEGGIVNNGTINASGQTAEAVGDGTQCTSGGSGCDLTGTTDIDDDQRGGGGGGSGGLVILATPGSLTVGTVLLIGGDGADGGNGTVKTSGGGGGGGGALHLLAPAASSASVAGVYVTAGSGGASTDGAGSTCTTESQTDCGTTRSGGVGGSMGGRGGYGGSGSSGSNSSCFYALLLVGDLTYPLSGGTPSDYNNDCNIARDGESGYILTTDVASPGALFP
ncbi:MAG: hypothetical protein GY720_11510 [bacterium]|nr:hypothetical protein [bacterium]